MVQWPGLGKHCMHIYNVAFNKCLIGKALFFNKKVSIFSYFSTKKNMLWVLIRSTSEALFMSTQNLYLSRNKRTIY